jgi:hypothetical protein
LNEYVTTSIPLIGRLTTLLTWLLFINTLLIGAVILLAYRSVGLTRRIHELESEQQPREPDSTAGKHQEHSIDDDRPIPLARHRYGDASKLLHRRP